MFLLYPFLQSSTYSSENIKLDWGSLRQSPPLFLLQQNETEKSFVLNPHYRFLAKQRLFNAANMIMHSGILNEHQLSRFLQKYNTAIDFDEAQKFAADYIRISKLEGINHDIAFAQMCLETGFLKFGGSVLPGQHNFCGLGAVDDNSPGESFDSPEIGITAHIQHLKAYASTDPLNLKKADPRFRFVERGSAKRIDDLNGKWASDPDYTQKIKSILKRMYAI